MNEYAERLKPLYHFAEKILFPVILILFPLLKVNQGIDLTDTAYSLGNYAFFGQNTVLWTLLTFLSNVLGFFFTKLPFGGTLLLPADQCHGPAWIPLFPDENAGCHCLSRRAFRNWNVLVSIRDFI